MFFKYYLVHYIHQRHLLVSARLVVLSYLYCTVNKMWGRGSGAGCAAFRVGRVLYKY